MINALFPSIFETVSIIFSAPDQTCHAFFLCPNMVETNLIKARKGVFQHLQTNSAVSFMYIVLSNSEWYVNAMKGIAA